MSDVQISDVSITRSMFPRPMYSDEMFIRVVVKCHGFQWDYYQPDICYKLDIYYQPEYIITKPQAVSVYWFTKN